MLEFKLHLIGIARKLHIILCLGPVMFELLFSGVVGEDGRENRKE